MVAIIVHGGAAKVAANVVESKLAHLRCAAKIGFLELVRKKSRPDAALDAVEKAVRCMEDSPYFNAGYGSSLTNNGHIEMDAIITDGRNLNFGAVASITDYSNPVSLARKIMEHSEHCLFGRDGAHEFARQQGFVPISDPQQLVNDLAKQRLDEYKTFRNAIEVDKIAATDKTKPDDHDTVGSVAVDWFGNFAAATSTGGITGKLPGRIGDSPVIGSGAYADNEIGAVSTTGHGEAIMKVCLARDVLYRYEKMINQPMETMNPMQRAIIESLESMKQRVDGYGGIIAIGNGHGDIGFGFNTQAMPWAYITVDDNDMDQIMAMIIDQNDTIDSAKIKIRIHYGYHIDEHLEIIE
ncbi:isoaspartyl peptidase/l-asparaginase-like [Dermatophagoides farinae]|uniref:Isoaspartyl peptidase/l-asparaginase-like n=1 Tax=Dermatophagoides farinae TaxID=6954 RepID=A0A9D4SDK9_DERFA|nr:isoaspartyl peptidase/L-asparaginase-like [Dermatophagoides farinae]KAH7638122.1 isoaspartyl peptidase/l-asparaginase-like [Dermatophagoides farinae]